MRPNVRQVNTPLEMKTLAGQQQDITVAAVAIGLGALPAECSHVFISVDTAPIMITLEGTAPVALASGHYMATGSSISLRREVAATAQFIRAGGTSAHVCATPMAI